MDGPGALGSIQGSPANRRIQWRRCSAALSATIGSIIELLKTDPKQYGQKKGSLKDARAANLRYNDGIT